MICNPKGIRTKRLHVFFGLVEDSIPPLLTSDHVTIPTFGIPSTVAQSRGLVTIRARHPENLKPKMNEFTVHEPAPLPASATFAARR